MRLGPCSKVKRKKKKTPEMHLQHILSLVVKIRINIPKTRLQHVSGLFK